MQGRREVMWPRLVANKILRKRSGSNNFVADFPDNTETLLEIPCSSHHVSSSPKAQFSDRKCSFKVFVSTWNVGAIAPMEDLNMEDLLNVQNNPCDIYVLGFQEIVTLNAGNVLGSENSRISMKWNSLIRAALNKKITPSDIYQETKVGELQKVYPVKDGNLKESSVPRTFRCIISKKMVGILISVWVRSDLHRYIRHPSVSCVGCGIMGCLGNKGSVSVRFYLRETSFCFVCSHLASGGKEGDERNRNSNVAEILSRTSFPRGPSLDLPRTILDHDRVILLGDLNYRISLPEATTRLLVEKGEWDVLLENDQLRTELTEGHVFEGWNEGVIEFGPTYKYCPNSDVYYGCLQGKRGEKRRAPAWCDRILWFGKGLKQSQYSRGECKLSDHRPVSAIFTAEVDVLRDSRGFESYFLSDRFERVPSQFEVCPTVDFLCNGRSSI
ncbi:PREDICTED: type IV inositol polyphosphate 5-phosphatase 9 isoform X2 [Nelumbo nucifera]|uniref:Type IV inositol polyphosphate 5-phosphatase 9 isoform X2 n=1 Tax=Nelumbo nucifera TaxID=4432 RepID=A0A1U8ATG1_NELNU|nr:PREDICTED: type IV inositol polyphosphate 5-phosphatase 9 isoform X2 [Nelumbo nucifera]